MANTTTVTGKSVMITGLDANWDWRASLPLVLKTCSLQSIQFNPSAANDVCQVRNGSAAGAVVFRCKCAGDTDQRVKYFERDSQIPPFIVITECTLGTAANASILLQFH